MTLLLVIILGLILLAGWYLADVCAALPMFLNPIITFLFILVAVLTIIGIIAMEEGKFKILRVIVVVILTYIFCNITTSGLGLLEATDHSELEIIMRTIHVIASFIVVMVLGMIDMIYIWLVFIVSMIGVKD